MNPKNLKYPFRWKDRKPHLDDKVLYIPDYYTEHKEWTFPGWETLFGNTNPVHIEYCSGNGLWIINKAKEFPEKNWVAVEWQFARARKIWSKMKNDNLSNLLIVAGEAVTFTKEYLPSHEVAEVYVNFPDPWPKERHAKNRLFQEPFISQLARILAPHGKLIVATDDPIYSFQISEKVRENAFFSSKFAPPYYVTEWPGYGDSYFDNLWRSQGKTIHYFQFECCPPPNVVVLPAFLESDLNWSSLKIPEGPILWEFDFGLFSKQVTLTDSAAFFSYTLAIEQFVKTLYLDFKERTVGVVLYRGSADIFSHIQVEEEKDPEVVGANLFADYLHRLASFLPEEVRPFCLFEGSHNFSEARFLQLTSKDRFWYLDLSLEKTLEAPQGVLLPEDAFFNEERFKKLLSSVEGSYRIIPEARLVELWQGLDKLFVLEEAISSQGQRKIKGFEAAGGEVIPL